ncbi:MAG: hypothetical protein ACRCWR_08535 [Saezia sp.]
MDVWLILIGGSVGIGLLFAFNIKNVRWALISAAFIPWVLLLAYFLFSEYALSYQGGGASMWPIAQLFGGTAAAFTGFITCMFVHSVLNTKKKDIKRRARTKKDS